MQHYGSRMLFLEWIKDLIAIADELKDMHKKLNEKNEQVFEILDDIGQGIDAFAKV